MPLPTSMSSAVMPSGGVALLHVCSDVGMSAYRVIRWCSGSVMCSSAFLISQPAGERWVQYFFVPSLANCSIFASVNPMSSSCCLTCSAAW